MKVMPFFVASPHALEWKAPELRCKSEVIGPDEHFRTWDYLSPVSVQLAFTLNADLLAGGVLGRTAEPSETARLLERSSVVLQVECPSTAFRQISEVTPQLNSPTGLVGLIIPAGEVANELSITAAVVLRTQNDEWGPLVPHLIGSRLVSEESRWTVTLEGKGSTFPVSAFDFEGTGYPEGALWYVYVQADRLADPFGSAVRLYVNSGHPRAASLLAAASEGGDLPEMLRYDLLATMLESVVTLPESDLREVFEEGTLGFVLNQQTQLWLGQPLADLVGSMAYDLPKFRAELQNAIGFMRQTGEAG